MSSTTRTIRSIGLSLPLLLAAAIALSVASALLGGVDGAKGIAIPVPNPVYQIKATSGGHTASLLNLPLGQPGVPQAPIPVDVDGDLLPDVTVAVNLVNVTGLFNNPPNIGAVIAPNIEIDRLVTATTLGQKSVPLNIQVELSVYDLQGQQPTTRASFGYDTGEGGSIPMHWKALVGGLQTFFNPVEAIVDTEGLVVAGVKTPGSPSAYDGPLSLVAAVDAQPLKANVDLRYDPWPDAIHVTYGTDSAGQHITYAHDFPGETDVVTKAHLENAGDVTDATASIDRMPKSIALDLNMAGGGGTVDWRADSDGRLPDINLDAALHPKKGRPLNAHAAIEALPAVMHAAFHAGQGDAAPMDAAFTSSGQGIGAIEASITNYDGATPPGNGFKPYVPTRRQFANFQQAAGSDPDRFIAARIEKIRSASFSKDTQKLTGNVDIGDGEQPLEIHGTLNGVGTAPDARDIEATSIISPLPDHIGFAMDTSAPKDKPVDVTYDASDPLDVDVSATVRPAGADPVTQGCGIAKTVCANLRLRNIPSHINAVVTKTDAELRVAVDDLPRVGGAAPDLFADLTTGPQVIPALNMPLSAHAELLGLPSHVRARVLTPATGSPSRAEVHTCDFDYAAAVCIPDPLHPQADIGAVSFTVRNALAHKANVPVPLPTAPNYVTVAGQGADFELTGQMTHLSELVYAKHDGLTGVRTGIGGGQPLQVLADVRGFDPNVFLASGSPHQPTLDIKAAVKVDPLPATLDLCMRENGNVIPATAPSNDVTKVCETKDPFALGAGNDLTNSPMTIAYRAASGFDVLTEATLVQHDVSVDASKPNAPHADRTMRGVVNVKNIPKELTANILTPKAGQNGQIRAHYDTANPLHPTDQIGVHFEAAMTEGDLVCADPRTPPDGYSSLCVQGDIQDIPLSADFALDQTKPVDNLRFTSTGHKLNLTGLRLASVAGTSDPLAPAVLIGEGSILGLPNDVRGTLVLPGTFDLRSPSNNLIDTVNLKVQNYLGPDPIPDGPPAQRTRYLDPTNAPLDAPTQTATFYQRQGRFKGIVHIQDVKGAGFLTSRAADGSLLDTNLFKVDFGHNQTLRAYADLLYQADPNDQSTLNSIIGDVTLEDLPAAMQLCFKGKDSHGGAAATAATATWCDDHANVPTDRGGFQFLATPSDPPTTNLDVDATVRVGNPSGVIAGRVRIDNIPNVVQGTFGEGKVDVGGYEIVNGTTLKPDGIDRIALDVANADIIDDGFGAVKPWGQRNSSTAPALTTPAVGSQYAQLAVKDNDFHARASIGAIEGSGFPGSDLQHIKIDNQHCARPGSQADYPDYPYFPENDATTKYTCARIDFEQVNGGSPDPLALEAIIDRGTDHIELRNAGITDIPAFVQLNLTQVPTTLNPDGTLRPRCARLSDATHPASCIAPLVRFDTPKTDLAHQPAIFGQLLYGAPDNLAALNGITPRDGGITAAENGFFDNAPGPDGQGWSYWAAHAPADLGGYGLRAKVAMFKSGVAAKVGLRIGIPQSLTVDQVQSWSQSTNNPYTDASDFNFHYRVSNSDGPIGAVGQLSGLLQLEDGSQIILGGGGIPAFGQVLDPAAGIPLPGEIGFAMYQRNNKQTGHQLVQMDGRVSDPGGGNSTLPDGTPMTVRARFFGAASSILGVVDASVRNIPTLPFNDTTTGPSFRLRAEIVGDGQSAPSGGSSVGAASAPRDCSFLLCTVTDIKVKKVDVHFDFKPTAEPGARLIEAVINTKGAKNGLEVKGWQDVNGENGNTAKFDVGADVYVDPLNVFFHAGIPILGSIDFALVSDLHVGVHLRETDDFQVRQNMLKIDTHNGSSDKASDIVFALNIYVLHGLAFSILGIFIGDPVLFSVDYVGLPFLASPFYDCQTGGLTTVQAINSINLAGDAFWNPDSVGPDLFDELTGSAVRIDGNSDRSFVAWPLNDNFIFGGILGSPINFIKRLGPPIFCAFSTDQTLIQGTPQTPHGGTKNPDDPMAVPGHPVPGLTGNEVSLIKLRGGSAVAAGPPDVTIAGGDYCGDVSATKVTITGAVSFPVPLGASCTAGNENRLNVQALDDIDITTGSISGAGDVTLSGRDVHVSGAIDATNVTINASGDQSTGTIIPGDITVSAAVTGDAVTVFATGDVDVASGGSLDSSARTATTNASGDGGGGHGGAGGGGSYVFGGTNDGGGATGDTLLTPHSGETEVRSEGGLAGSTRTGAAAGRGGGTIRVTGDHVTVASGGAITANGGAGNPPPSDGACKVDDDHPNTGSPGSGGGAGGGIVLAATVLDIGTGRVQARGGNGGSGNAGGGGGGGGGIVKQLAAVERGSVDVALGAKGTSGCPADVGDGADGGNGYDLKQLVPTSRVTEVGGLWHSGGTVTLPVKAAANVGSSGSFTVILCGQHQSPAQVNNPNGSFGIDIGSASLFLPSCNPASTQLASTTVSGDEAPADLTMTATGLADGFWGFYTIAYYDPGCFFCFPVVEQMPSGGPMSVTNPGHQINLPDGVIGMDQKAPAVTLTSGEPNGRTTVANTTVTLNISATENLGGGVPDDNLSGIAALQCSNVGDATHWTSCGQGAVGWTLDGTGNKVYVRAVDGAGNETEKQLQFTIDASAPSSTLTVTPNLPETQWHTTAPSFSIAADQGDVHRIDWWFDGDSVTPCTSAFNVPLPACAIPAAAVPQDGAHHLHWQAVDDVGNREPVRDRLFKIDRQKPLVALLTAPTQVDPSSGWFKQRPFIVIGSVDNPGGSGVSTVEYSLTRHGAPDATTGWKAYTGVFALPPGSWDVCIRATDLAGNPAVAGGDGVSAATGCRTGILVDDAAPSAAITTTPAAPDGGNGWFTSTPTVTVTVDDRIAPSDPTDPAVLAVTNLLAPAVTLTATTQGSGVAATYVAVDGLPYRLYTAPFTVAEGVHEVRAYTVDTSGQRSAVVVRQVNVDLSPAEPSARTTPQDPARNGWFRRVPAVVLKATDGDRNAGLQRIAYRDVANPTLPTTTDRCDATWATYTGPLTALAKGRHRVDYCAVDLAGRSSTVRSVLVNIDPDNAIVKATSSDPTLWLKILNILGPSTAKLQWEVTEPTSGRVSVNVVVYNLAGIPVRNIDGGTYTVTPGQKLSGSTAWDGKDNTLTGIVPVGVYYYRVVVVDDAGNTSMSGESRPITIKATIL